MKEIISLHIGQAGIQVGESVWELFCLEHGIQPDGHKIPDNNPTTENDTGFHSIFRETMSGTYVPRALYIDSEPNVIDEVKSGPHRDLFDPDMLIAGKEDAANNYARGYYVVAKREIGETVLKRMRKLIEGCDNLQGFLLYNSVGGGTGSGAGHWISEKLSQDHYKKHRIGFPIYPSPLLSGGIVEPYNATLSTRACLQGNHDMDIILDNEALYGICRNQLGIEGPSFSNINRLIAQAVSAVTAPIRFGGALNNNFSQILTNLISYPRICFMLLSLAPIVSVEKSFHGPQSVDQITNSVFDPNYMLAKCDPGLGKYIAACLLYRGDVVPGDVHPAVNDIRNKRTIKFVDYCPTGFKVGVTGKAPIKVVPGGDIAKTNRDVCMIACNTGIRDVFEKIGDKYDRIFARRAFVHWYVWEEMEEGEFIEAREDCMALEKDFEEVGIENFEAENYEEVEDSCNCSSTALEELCQEEPVLFGKGPEEVRFGH